MCKKKHPITGFENCHLHTDYSLLDGTGMVTEYATQAPKINQRFLCITDHGMMGAVPSQIKTCEEHGIHPIFGCEIYINPNQPEVAFGKKTADYIQNSERQVFLYLYPMWGTHSSDSFSLSYLQTSKGCQSYLLTVPFMVKFNINQENHHGKQSCHFFSLVENVRQSLA